MPDRIEHDFLEADLGDARRNRRLGRVAAQLAQAPAASISAACGGWAEAMAAYRLLYAPEVTPGAILVPHQRALLARAATVPCVLVIQDTSEIDFSHMPAMEGCGPLNDEARRGFFMHSLYALSEAGLPLGVLDTAILARRDEDFRQAAARKHTPIGQKESWRWVRGYLRTQEAARRLPGCEVFSISDREGDIYEVFQAWLEAGADGGPRAHWIIRANQDRALEGLAVEVPQKLFAALAAAPELGTMEFRVSARRQKRKIKGSTVQVARSARMGHQPFGRLRAEWRLRAMRITPARPPASLRLSPPPPRRVPFRRGGKLPAVSFWAVLAEEIDPPPGEEPLRWLLLTSAEVATPEAARRIVALYLRRWDIEVFHRVLKTGCRVEALQLKDHQAVRNCLVLYAIIAPSAALRAAGGASSI